MKKLLFAIGSIAAMTIIFSCSADSLDDNKKENSTNKNSLPSATSDTIPTPQNIDDIGDKDKGQG